MPVERAACVRQRQEATNCVPWYLPTWLGKLCPHNPIMSVYRTFMHKLKSNQDVLQEVNGKKGLHPWDKTVTWQTVHVCLCLFFLVSLVRDLVFGFTVVIFAYWFLSRICSTHQDDLTHSLFPESVPIVSLLQRSGRSVGLSVWGILPGWWGWSSTYSYPPASASRQTGSIASYHAVSLFTSHQIIFCTRKLAPRGKRSSVSYLLPHFQSWK